MKKMKKHLIAVFIEKELAIVKCNRIQVQLQNPNCNVTFRFYISNKIRSQINLNFGAHFYSHKRADKTTVSYERVL